MSRASVTDGLSAAQLRPLWDLSVLVVACLFGVALALALRAGIFGIPMIILVWLSLSSYGYTVLRCVAQGRTQLPAPGWNTMNPMGARVLVLHFGLFAALLVFLTTTPWIESTLLRWGLLFALLASFPASAVTMALTYDLVAAFHPATLAEVITRLGRRYGLLLAGSVAICAGWVLATTLAGGLLRVSSLILTVWGVLAVFALTGAVVRAGRLDLDIPGDVDTEREMRDRQERIARWQQELDHAYASIRSDLPAQGHRTIARLIADEQGSAEVHEWLLEQMLAWQEPRHALRVAVPYVERLLADGEPHTALGVYGRCRRIGAGEALPPPLAWRLAEYARAIGRDAIADELTVLAEAGGGRD